MPEIPLSGTSAFLSAFIFFTGVKDFRWCPKLQKVRTVLWTWTVRPKIRSVLRILIQPVQVEPEFWQSKVTIIVSSGIFVYYICTDLSPFYIIVHNINIDKVCFIRLVRCPNFVPLFFTSRGYFVCFFQTQAP